MFDNFVTIASRLNQSIWTLCLMILVLVILVFPVLFWNCTLVCCMSLFSSSLQRYSVASPHLSFSRLTPPPVPDLLVGVSVWNGKQKKKNPAKNTVKCSYIWRCLFKYKSIFFLWLQLVYDHLCTYSFCKSTESILVAILYHTDLKWKIISCSVLDLICEINEKSSQWCCYTAGEVWRSLNK